MSNRALWPHCWSATPSHRNSTPTSTLWSSRYLPFVIKILGDEVNQFSLLQLIAESHALKSLGVELPSMAVHVCRLEKKLRAEQSKSLAFEHRWQSGRLVYLVAEYERVQARILPVYAPLVSGQISRVEALLEPVCIPRKLDNNSHPCQALTTLTWTSLNVQLFLEGLAAGIEALEGVVTKANDMIDCRIETGLEEIRQTSMVTMPGGSSMAIVRSQTDWSLILYDMNRLLWSWACSWWGLARRTVQQGELYPQQNSIEGGLDTYDTRLMVSPDCVEPGSPEPTCRIGRQ